LSGGNADGCGRDLLKREVVGGDDTIVENVFDVGLRGEAAKGSGVIRRGCLHGSNAKVFISMSEMRPCSNDLGVGIAGYRGVAIEHEVAMGGNAGGVNLGVALDS
jgi:hypothetical protein